MKLRNIIIKKNKRKYKKYVRPKVYRKKRKYYINELWRITQLIKKNITNNQNITKHKTYYITKIKINIIKMKEMSIKK